MKTIIGSGFTVRGNECGTINALLGSGFAVRGDE